MNTAVIRAGLGAVVAVLALVAPAAAQACLEQGRGEAGAWVGAAHYDLGPGLDGIEMGAEGRLRRPRFTAGAAVYALRLESGRANPVGVRVSIGAPVASMLGIGLCVSGLGGVTAFSTDDTDAVTLAGGAAVSVQRPLDVGPAGATLTPYLSIRGLAGAATGSVMGESVDVGGLEVGGEGGLALRLGRFVMRLSAVLGGFDPALGTTAFPHQAYRLMAGVGF